jgi:hypothetical protein
MYFYDWLPREIDAVKTDDNGLPVKDAAGNVVLEKKQAIFEGKVKVKIPKHSERMGFLKSMSLNVNEKGEVEKASNLDMSEKIFEYAISHVEDVNLTRKSDGLKFTKEMLEYDQDGAEVLASIGNQLIQGVRLSKS